MQDRLFVDTLATSKLPDLSVEHFILGMPYPENLGPGHLLGGDRRRKQPLRMSTPFRELEDLCCDTQQLLQTAKSLEA